MKTPTLLPREVFRDAAQTQLENANRRPSSLGKKIASASQVACKEEEFNVWHAAKDNVLCSGANRAWGSLSQN